jgi:hypothetical protein
MLINVLDCDAATRKSPRSGPFSREKWPYAFDEAGFTSGNFEKESEANRTFLKDLEAPAELFGSPSNFSEGNQG